MIRAKLFALNNHDRCIDQHKLTLMLASATTHARYIVQCIDPSMSMLVTHGRAKGFGHFLVQNASKEGSTYLMHVSLEVYEASFNIESFALRTCLQ